MKRSISLVSLSILMLAMMACMCSAIPSLGGSGGGQVLALHILETTTDLPPDSNDPIAAGKHLIGFRVVVENQSDTSQVVTPYSLRLVDSEGFVTSADSEYFDANLPMLPITDLLPGERAEGWAFFSIKDESTPARLKFADGLTGEVLGTVEFSTAPPASWSTVTPPTDAVAMTETSTFNGYTLMVLQIVDPAPPIDADTDRIPNGFHALAVEIQVKNESGSEPLTVSDARVFLIDEFGFVHRAEYGLSTVEPISSLDLAVGEITQGYVTFLVRDGYAPSYLRYAPDWLDESQGMTSLLK